MNNLNFMLYGQHNVPPEHLSTSLELLHRQLRPEIPKDYRCHILKMMAEGVLLLTGTEGERVHSLALFRIFETTLGARRLYIDDLVTDVESRSRTIGSQTIAWIERHAAEAGCSLSTLDSGPQRSAAHRFYMKQGYAITAFCFEKAL